MHESVLLQETLQQLRPTSGDLIIDGTLGLGGHSTAILPYLAPGGTLIGIDRDPTRLKGVEEKLRHDAEKLDNVTVDVEHASYADIPQLLSQQGRKASGILLDLGFASDQLAPERGFSFMHKGPLAMTYDPGTASLIDRLKKASESEIATAIRDLGEERYWKRIARSIRLRLGEGELRSTRDLRDAIVSVIPRAPGHSRTDPATRTFQALRMWVNGEMDHLETFLSALTESVAPGGRVAIISFHSLEDGIVMRAFRQMQKDKLGSATRTPIQPSLDEVVRNPRSRSAKLRTFTFNS